MIVLMRNGTDCEVAAIATASGIPYEKVQDAFLVGDCGPLTNPVRGNPLASYAALSRLGLWKRNIAWGDLAERKAEPGKTIILIHSPDAPILQQHWVVLAGYTDTGFLCYWGDSEQPRHVSSGKMLELFLGGWPNCAYQIIQGSAWQRFLRWIGFSH